MRTPTIVAIGEALWDVFPDERRPGGAPCNMAFHSARLGNAGAIITRVGDDTLGVELIAFLQERGVLTQCAQIDAVKPTGTVTVTMNDGEPQYAITKNVAWDFIKADRPAYKLVETADAVCIGSLAQRSEVGRTNIRRLVSHARDRSRVIFDVNLRPPFDDLSIVRESLELVGIVKLNDAEAARLSAAWRQPALAEWLVGEMGIDLVCVTCGANGATATTSDGQISLPGVPVDVTAGDVVGAGDAFTAAMAHGLVRGAPPADAAAFANRYAALVASKRGAMPMIDHVELRQIGMDNALRR